MSTLADVEYIGPFQQWNVVVDGRRVPFISAVPLDGGLVRLVLDDRYGLVLDLKTAEMVVSWVADAIAVASGYTCHPRRGWNGPKPRAAFPRALSAMDAGEAQ